MTIRAMGLADQIAALVTIRDDLDREAFYYRRRGTEQHDREHAILMEEHVAALDDVIANLRLERQQQAREEAET